jgi:hypothetical protein
LVRFESGRFGFDRFESGRFEQVHNFAHDHPMPVEVSGLDDPVVPSELTVLLFRLPP